MSQSLFLLLIFSQGAWATVDLLHCPPYTNLESTHSSNPANEEILNLIKKIRVGGGYDKSNGSEKGVVNAENIKKLLGATAPESVEISHSMCSSATYLIYLSYLAKHGADVSKLYPQEEADGIGAWGQWNANASGAAKLLWKTHGAKNFTSPAQAEPGDFAKLFYKSDEESSDVDFGKLEHGHLTVFLGCIGNTLCYWSSNANGAGVGCTRQSRIGYTIFSRVNDHTEDSVKELNMVADPQSPVHSDDQLAKYLDTTIIKGPSAIDSEISPLLQTAPKLAPASSPSAAAQINSSGAK